MRQRLSLSTHRLPYKFYTIPDHGSLLVGFLSLSLPSPCTPLIPMSLYLSGTSVWRPQSRYSVSHIECRTKFPQNRRCRAKIALHPPKSRFRTFLRTPLSHFPLIPSREGVRRAGGGYRGTFGFRKRIVLQGGELQGGIAATVTPVALHSLRHNRQLSSSPMHAATLPRHSS